MPVHSKTWVAKLEAPSSGQTDFDAKHPGLKVRVYSSGRRVWFIRGRLRGSASAPKFILLGDYPAISESDAEHAAANARHMLRQGINPNQQRAEQVIANNIASMTFATLAEEYIEKGTAKLAQTTKRVRANALRGKHFAEWRDRPLAWIIQGRVNALKNSIPDTAQFSPMSALRAALRYAEDNEYIDDAPDVEIPKAAGDAAPFIDVEEGSDGKPAIKLDELALVLEALELVQQRFPLSHWPRVWGFAALTGARPSAYLGARWEEFDLSSNPVWHLSKERSKLRRPIDIPLSEAAASVLRGLDRKPNGLIWPGRDGTKPREDLPGDQVGLISGMLLAHGYRESFWPGRFRDTFMTWLDVQEHASERAIALLVDHKAPAELTTRGRHYAKVQAANLARRLANEWASMTQKARQARRRVAFQDTQAA